MDEPRSARATPDVSAVQPTGRDASKASRTPEPYLPKPAPTQRVRVILVHGLWMPGWETLLLRRRLAAAGYGTASFVYPTIGVGLDANADRLAERVASEPEGDVHLVGHSLGGALILRMFERHSVARSGRIVCLGSPLNGSRPGAVLDRHPLGRRIVGRSIHDLLARGGCGRWSGVRELGIIAGDVPLGMGRLLGGLPAPNDGTVAVDETRLPGATDHIVLHCTHLSMLWSRPVALQVVRFLAAGRFEHG